MYPIATEQNLLRQPLDDLFGAPANVRLLRVLADGAPGPIGASEAARQAGLSPAGARRALLKLAKTGFVERIGSGRAQQYALRNPDRLTDAVRILFQCERERYQALLAGLQTALKPLTEIRAAWLERSNATAGGELRLGVLSDVRSLSHLGEQIRERIIPIEREFDVTIEVRALSQADLPDFGPDKAQMITGYLDGDTHGTAATHAERDRRAALASRAIAELLDAKPGLLVRATRHVEMALQNEPGTAEHDLKEWRSILAHYSMKRLREFLVSESSRAERLRQSSPFFAVLNAEERDRVFAAVDPSA